LDQRRLLKKKGFYSAGFPSLYTDSTEKSRIHRKPFGFLITINSHYMPRKLGVFGFSRCFDVRFSQPEELQKKIESIPSSQPDRHAFWRRPEPMKTSHRYGYHFRQPDLVAVAFLVASSGCAILENSAPAIGANGSEIRSPSIPPAQTQSSSGASGWTPAFFQPTSDFTPTHGIDTAANLLRNSGFEGDFFGWNRDPDPPGALTEIDSTIAHTGSRSLRITFDGSADVNYWHVNQSIPVEPNTTYRLQAYLRVSGVHSFQSVCLIVTDGRGWDTQGYSTPDLYTTQDWTLVSTIDITTLPDAQSLWVAVGRGDVGGKFPISGTVWVDDVTLVRLPAYISPSASTLHKGDSLALTAANGKAPYRWNSSNPAVASVGSGDQNRDAIVTALSAGDTEITAVDAEGKTARSAVHVLAQSAITVHADRILREVPNGMFGSNIESISLENEPDPGDVITDPAFIRDVADLGLASLRFPGGTYSNSYDFSRGRGSVDWIGGPDQFNMGGMDTAQFIQFLRAAGIPGAMITANVYKSGSKNWSGDNWISPRVAADWVDYTNHQSGFRVEYWELGNEVNYSDAFPWDSDPQVPGLTREMYLQKVREWSRAMKAVDPTIKIGAVAMLPGRGGGEPEWWDFPLIQERASEIDFLIVHPYIGANPYMEDGAFVDRTAESTFAWIWATQPISDLRRWILTFAPARAATMEIQASEWGVISFPEMQLMNDSLLNAVLNTDLFWDMVQEGADGANIWNLAEWPFASLEPVSGGRKFAQYYMLWMNRRRSGKWLLDTQVTAPTYTFQPLGDDAKVYAVMDSVPYLSAYATLSADRKHLYLIVTNKSGNPQAAAITLDGFFPRPPASVWQMTSARWDDTGVVPATSVIQNASSTIPYTFPARSVTSFVFDLQ
jgi:alpha-L-arabinofuranosidase